MKEKKPNIYVPGKNRRHRKHYWWRYLLVFILGQALVLPEFLLTLGTASTAMDLNTIMSFIPGVKADDYLTEKSKKMTVLDLAMYFASPSFKPQCLDDINDIVKLNSIITNVSSKNEKAEKIVGAVITDDFMKTDFKDLGKYFTEKLEIAPVLSAAGVTLPSIAETFLYKTPVAYFGKTTTESIKMVKGDTLNLAGSKVQVLPAAASKSGFTLTVQPDATNISVNNTSVTVDSECATGTYTLNAKAQDESVTNELELSIEVVDSLTLGKPVKCYFDEDEQIFVWENVDFCKEYLVTLPDTSTKTIKGNVLSAEGLSLTDDETVTLKVKALSPDAKHAEGEEATLSFTYKAKVEEGGTTKAMKREGEKTGEDQEVTTPAHVDVYDKQNDEDHPNGYDDETGELIRTSYTISDLGNVFSNFDIGGLLGSATVGDITGMFSGGGLSVNTTEPTHPSIKVNKEATDIMDVFSALPIASLMGGDFMSALNDVKVSMILKDKEDDPILGSIVNKTFGELTNSETDLLTEIMGGKKVNDILKDLPTDGLMGLIADCCLIKPADYPTDCKYINGEFWTNTEPSQKVEYNGPVDVQDKFNDLTIGQALGNENGNSGNAIMDCLADIKLSSKTVGDEMKDALKEKTVGELLNMESSSENAILDTLINCHLDGDELEETMNNMKLETVIGAGNMYEYDTANNPTKVKGIWALMFKPATGETKTALEKAKEAKISEMGDLMSDMGDTMANAQLKELKEAGIISSDLTGNVRISATEEKPLEQCTISEIISAVSYLTSLISH